MGRRPQILVIGSDKDHCSEAAYRTAYQIGLEVAKRGAILVSGGLGGVMEAASQGAKNAEGFVIGIIPQDNKTYANKYCDAVIATGIGSARDFLTAYSADAVIVVEGGAGTLIEVAAAYQKKIPIIAITGTGGIADKIAHTYLDDRKLEPILAENSPGNAVNMALSLIQSGRPEGSGD